MFVGIVLVDVHARVSMYVRVWVHVACMRARVFVYRLSFPNGHTNILCTYSRRLNILVVGTPAKLYKLTVRRVYRDSHA